VTSSSHRGTSVRTVDSPMALAVCDLRLLLEPEAVRRTVLHGLDAASFKAGVDRMVAAEDGEDLYERSLANRAFTAISTPAAVTPPSSRCSTT